MVQQPAADDDPADDRGAARRGATPYEGGVRPVVQPDRRRRIEWPGESPGPERACPLPDRQPLGHGPGRAVRDQAEHLMPEGGRQRGHRQHAQQGHRAELTALPVPAGVAAPDMPSDPLTQQYGEPPVPALQDPGQFRAGFPAGAGDQQHAER